MRIATALAALALLPAVSHAHGMRTAYLELTETAGGVLATWKTAVPAPGVAAEVGDRCAVPDAPDGRTVAFRCDGPLDGRRVAVAGLGPLVTEAVVRVLRTDGGVRSHVLTPAAPAWVIPSTQAWTAVALDYVRLGVAHILGGADHLLFLLALVLYVRRPRAVLVTETAFTLSHSVSFSAVALGWVHVFAPAAEACIALSLVLVALDVGSACAERDAAWQGPAIALVFGLVHGLGFAGALSEVGLPERAVASALVGFGLGVEIGQVAFIVALLAGIAALRRVVPVSRIALAGSWVVGVTGSYWLLQRLWVCFG
jgi:hydrogenase/urease accessory protein HupE